MSDGSFAEVTSEDARVQGHAPGRPILLLGMHRSGTSCLAGCLEAAGLYLGEVNTWARSNALGNREKRALMYLNDKVLAANGGTWRAPPETVIWPDHLVEEGREMAGSMAQDGPWGFKDPRTLLTLDGWLVCVGNAELVASFRHPLAVAQSLHQRDPDLSIDEGLGIWLAYNQRLLAIADRRPVTVISFDRAGDAYVEAVVDTARALHLPQPEAAGQFYDTGLRTHGVDDDSVLPPDLRRTYARLKELAR